MSDTAIFISIAADELSSNGQLPGDMRSLRARCGSGDRIVHEEVVTDAPLPEKTLNVLQLGGTAVTLLPASADTSAALVGGLMARLHEFICAYPRVSTFILAGADVDRLAPIAMFLKRGGFYVIVVGPDRSRLDAVGSFCDDTAGWTSGRGNSRGRDRDRDNRSKDRESSPRKEADPYEVLVEEVTKVRENGKRVLLTSLKQRIRKRIRRFDETRLKDADGKPMRQFKDFVLDAVNRGLIQLVEKGNASHILLPNEDIPEDTDEEDDVDDNDDDGNEEGSGDPLLDSVDSPETDDDGADEEEEKDLPPLKEKNFDVKTVNEEAPAPQGSFMTFLENILPSEGLTLTDLLDQLATAQEKGNLELTNRELKSELQNAFYNELLEGVDESDPVTYVVVDDWKDIIDFL